MSFEGQEEVIVRKPEYYAEPSFKCGSDKLEIIVYQITKENGQPVATRAMGKLVVDNSKSIDPVTKRLGEKVDAGAYEYLEGLEIYQQVKSDIDTLIQANIDQLEPVNTVPMIPRVRIV